MEDFEFKAKSISRKYGERILKMLYENPNMSHKEVCERLAICPANCTCFMKKMIAAGLIQKTKKGKYTYFSLNEEVKRSLELKEDAKQKTEEKMEFDKDSIYKTLFFNIAKEHLTNQYISYFLIDIIFTYNYFKGIELIMLLFILGIYSYEEGQTFSSLFGLSDIESIETQENVLSKFRLFLSEVVYKYHNASLDEETKER